MTPPRFLLITDTHLADGGSELRLDDLSKTTIPSISHPTREGEIGKLFERIASDLRGKEQRLDGVLFAGDAQRKGLPGGHKILFDLILANFGEFGIEPGRIVAAPGNHDVKKWSEPSSRERYEAFAAVWKANGCIVPWLDGVDSRNSVDASKHFLAAHDNRWIVYPLNTSNWSQVQAELPKDLATIWNEIPARLSANAAEQERLSSALNGLRSYDMAHVSDAQLEVMRGVIASAPRPESGPQLRVLLMHHHLRAPGLRVELKAFESISNLEQIRSFIRQAEINLVIHGHKHEHAVHFDHLGGERVEEGRRVAVLSAGAIDDGRDTDAARILAIEGIPYTPTLQSTRFGLARGGLNAPMEVEKPIRLWMMTSLADGPEIIQGSDFNEVYARASDAAREIVPRGTLIVHLDLPANSVQLDLPEGYPEAASISVPERQQWLREIVDWWQLPQSHRDKSFPYPHGSRLRRYGGVSDQIERLATMLESGRSSPTLSSRALAILVDPIRDFDAGSEREAFPSFTMLQIKKRQRSNTTLLDITGFYRAQEFSQWWPVNIAELRAIQVKLCRRVGIEPGRITTITTEARLDERAPGQVHVPIFDRWLDQAPQNLFLLAGILSQQIHEHPNAKDLLGQWRQALRDFLVVAQARSTDGSPISSEGLKALRDYIAALCPADRPRPQFFSSFVSLVEQSEQFERSAKDTSSFEIWARVVKRVVPEILNATTSDGP
ncbi:metallophosphoesterase [Mesorhizobium intechi]|nr:metallophosphoesterase [Mesorhizobium intechi]